MFLGLNLFLYLVIQVVPFYLLHLPAGGWGLPRERTYQLWNDANIIQASQVIQSYGSSLSAYGLFFLSLPYA